MAFWVNIQNGKVVQVRDTDPHDSQWIQAVEVRNPLGANQRYGDHYFDITKTPAEIVWPAVDLTPAEIENRKQQFISQIADQAQRRLDTFAQTRNYDGILSAATYASSTVPKFAQEGRDAVNLRDATWATLYTIMGKVQAGTRPMPSGFADIEPELPVLKWTA